MNNVSTTQRLASYIAGQEYHDIPPDVVRRVKELVLDDIGCAFGGYVTEVAPIVIGFAKELGAGSESTLIGDGTKVSCPYAAGVNAYLANRLDYDETSRNGHIGAPIGLTALALGERLGASGQDVINAITAGYEVSSRVGSNAFTADLEPQDIRNNAFPDFFVFGPTAASAKLLKLDELQTRRAIDLAWSSPPSLNPSFLSDPKFGIPNMLKNNYLSICRAGIEAAFLARRGFTCSQDVLDRDQMVPLADLELGKEWHVLKHLQFKPWSTCRFIHGAIELVLRIIGEAQLHPDDIEEIIFRSFKWVCSAPYDNTRPGYWNDITWSVPYGIALAVLGYEPGPDWYHEENFHNPELQALARRVKVEILPEATRSFLENGGMYKLLTEIEVRASGNLYRLRQEGYKGDPDRPLSKQEREGKFRRLAGRVISREGVNEVIGLTENLEKIADINELTGRFASERGEKQ